MVLATRALVITVSVVEPRMVTTTLMVAVRKAHTRSDLARKRGPGATMESQGALRIGTLKPITAVLAVGRSRVASLAVEEELPT